ncbi:MAG: hypothetical protein HYZ29_16020 [Myxococcales bacterium]|nr:hypothetical protein [Myxococcales bacterium]
MPSSRTITRPTALREAAEVAHAVTATPSSVGFELTVRGLYQRDDEGTRVTGETPDAALTRAVELDISNLSEPIMRWSGLEAVVALDFDRPENAPPLVDGDLQRFFPSSVPRPLFAWRTHGAGLRVIFVATPDATAVELAAAWALLAPYGRLASWRLEVKTDTRHPSGARGDQTCGPVLRFEPSASTVVPGNNSVSAATQDEVADWMSEHGLSYGRHRCIWCGADGSSGNPPFVVDDRGAKCFRCGQRRSWDALVGRLVDDDRASPYEAARSLVHLPHQRHVLRDMRPGAPEKLYEHAWRLFLRVANADRLASPDEKEAAKWRTLVDRAANTIVDVARSVSGAWVDAVTLQVRRVTGDRTLAELPWARSRTMVDAALNGGPLRGFVPIDPVDANTVVGPYVEPAEGSIRARRPRRRGDPPPVDLGTSAPTQQEVDLAFGCLGELLPGLSRGYLCALIAADFYAQRASGLPPILAVTGGSGTAKTASARLAGGCVGRRAADVALGEPEGTRRGTGLAIESGAGVLILDEVGRVPDVYRRLEAILSLNASLTFAAKYANERTVRVTSPVALVGSTLPRSITRSPEIARRCVGFRLVDRATNWERWGDISAARSRNELRPHLDVITRWVWWLVWSQGRNISWRDLCRTEFGAVPLVDLDLDDLSGPGVEPAVRALYERFRSAPESDLTSGTRWAGWLDASPGSPAALELGELVDFEADHRTTRAETAELERLDLAPVLRLDKPSLRLLVRRRSGRWLARFVEVGVAKGRGLPRASLPPAGPEPSEALDNALTESAPAPPSDSDTHEAHDDPDYELMDFDGGTARAAKENVNANNRPLRALRAAGGSDRTADAGASPCAVAQTPVFVDFETRSMADLRALGGRLYAADPSTEVVCAAALLPDATWVAWTPGTPPPANLFAAIEAGADVAAHNAHGFDRHVWRGLGWPEPKMWIDTMHLARLVGLGGSLEALGQAVGVPKDTAARKMTLALSRPDRRTGTLTPVDPDQRASALRYCRGDVEVLAAGWAGPLQNVAASEIDVRTVDAAINARGFELDIALAQAIVRLDNQEVRDLQAAAPVPASVLRSPKQFLAWLRGEGLDLRDARGERLEPLVADATVPEPIRAAIRARLATSGIAAKKAAAALQTVSPDGRIRDALVYHSAHTGRWGGSRFNPQNLPRGVSMDVDAAIELVLRGDLAGARRIADAAGVGMEDVLGTLIRPCIRAGAGRLLAVVDYASIEARALLWLAGDDDGLELYRREGDPYVSMAAVLFAIDPDTVSRNQRQLGKACVLGCGYGMGVDRFRAHAESYGIDWSALDVTPAQSVDAWRDSHPLVAGTRTGAIREGHVARRGGLWRTSEQAAIRAVLTGLPTSTGKCTWRAEARVLSCALPSGRSMVYRGARIHERDGRAALKHLHRGTEVWTFGGKLVENVVQAVCRDLLADALVRLERAGHEVVLHVHDEIVCEVDRETDLTAIAELVKTPPDWADGLPIAVEGYVARRYRK